MINRATFYAHYADKQDLYDSLIDQFLASFTGILDEQNLVDGNNVHVKEIETVLSRFYEFVRDNPEIAQMITDRAHDQRLKIDFWRFYLNAIPSYLKNWKLEKKMLWFPMIL